MKNFMLEIWKIPFANIFEHNTARQNGFIYKVKTQANDYQNLKVDTLRVQNNRKLKSYTVEFFSGKFLSAPSEIWTHDPQIWSLMCYH